MLAAEEVKAAEKEEAATIVAKQKAAAIATDNSIRQRMVLELGQRSRKELKEEKDAVEEKAERLRQSSNQRQLVKDLGCEEQ